MGDRRRVVNRVFQAGVACAAISVCSGAQAQQAPSSLGAAQVDQPVVDIVVTAQKREERLKDVPSSVAVLSGAALRDQNADRLENYVARIPGLVLNAEDSGRQQITIRGLSTGTAGAATVSVYIDDAPVGASNGDGAGGLVTPDLDSNDLQRIEVLRGPQGTLYGASNIGGLLKYVTVPPNLGRVEGAAAIDGNMVDHGGTGYAARGRVSIPIAEDKVAVLLSGYARKDPGFIDDDGRGRDDVDTNHRYGGRAAFSLRPTEALSITGAAILANAEADGFTAIDADPATLQPIYGKYQQRRAEGSDRYRTRTRLYYVTGSYDFGWAKLTETTSFNRLHNISRSDYTAAFGPLFDFGIPNLGYTAATDINQKKFTQEARLSGDIGQIDWIGGIFYTNERSDSITSVPTFDATTGAPVVIPSLLFSETQGQYREIAGFGQVNYRFTDRFNVTIGGRYAHNKQQNTTTSSGALIGPDTVTPLSARDNVATFTVSSQYKLNPDMAFYGRIASGYRPGGGNDVYAPVRSFGPDRVVNYEVGLKGGIPSSKLFFDIAAFYVDWTGIQLQLRTDLGLSYTDNAGKASSRGVEAGASYSPLRGLTFSGSAAYTDAHLDKDIINGSFGLRGDALPYAQRWKGSFDTDYKFTLSGPWSAFVGAGVYYTSSTRAEFQGDAATPRVRLPGYVTADARLGVTRDHWTIALIGKNILDKEAFNGVRPLTLSATGVSAFSVIQPRTLLVSIKLDY